MALTSLFFKSPKPSEIRRTVGDTETPIILDATVKETFSIPAEPTKNPVEDGADITDHIIIRPCALQISGIITETPFEGVSGLIKSASATVGASIGQALGPFNKVLGGAGTLAGAFGGAAVGSSIASSIFGPSGERILSAVAIEFQQLRDARQPVDIQTGLRLYTGYVMSTCTISRRGGKDGTGGSIEVDLGFEQLIRVSSQTTRVAIPKLPGGLGKSNLGKQSKDALSADKNTGASILKKAVGAIWGH